MRRLFTAIGLVLLVLAACLIALDLADAEAIPGEALRHRATLIRCARAQWGLDAPTAAMGAQVHQESRWREGAVSPVGAQGLAQIMPATGRWLDETNGWSGGPQPYNPGWALRAMTAYDRWLWDRVVAATPCDRLAMALSAYNGGLGWIIRDRERAARLGLDPTRWWGEMEVVNAGRSASAWRENRGYPRRILLALESLYERAGWGAAVCGEAAP